MKWCIEDSNMTPTIHEKLKKSMTQGNLSKELMDTILTNFKANITFRTDNIIFIEKLVNQIIGLCYKYNVIIYSITDNKNCLYKCDKIIHNEPRESDKWYLTCIKKVYSSTNIAYHLHFSYNEHQCHLLIAYDTNIIE